MRHRTTRAAVILLVAVVLLSLPACRKPFTPQAISADLVPEDVRHTLSIRKDVSDVVWHVSQADWHDGLPLHAATYTITSRDGYTLRCWWIEELGGSTNIDNDEVFLGVTPGSTGVIEAGGYCFDSHATEVVGKTTEGREFRCPVTNGFWLIVVNDAINQGSPSPVVEHWAEITARSSSGKVLHRLDLGRPM